MTARNVETGEMLTWNFNSSYIEFTLPWGEWEVVTTERDSAQQVQTIQLVFSANIFLHDD